MRSATILQYKSVQAILVLISLAGAFVLGRCSGSESRNKSTASLIAEKQEDYDFSRKCGENRADIPCCSCLPPFPFQPFLQPQKKPQIITDNDTPLCSGDLVPAVQRTAEDLAAQAIRYGIGPLSDCSGIFHRVLMGLKKRCPDHEYPSIKRYRDSRKLARWYHEQGKLILINDVLQQADVIKPGMALFYGRSGSVYRDFTVNDLVSNRTGIDHVGVVVSVAKDKEGKIVNYKLFHGHGRKGKTTASSTNWHRRVPTRASYPPLGNGRQQLVAAAQIIHSGETAPMVAPSSINETAMKE